MVLRHRSRYSKLVLNGDVPSIRFRLTNISAASLHSYPFQLPRGNPDSISLVAVRADGRVLPNAYRISDPGPGDHLEIRAGESREGAYTIEDTVQIEPADREQDIFVAWSYLWWGSGSKRPSSPVTGVVVIPARKATLSFVDADALNSSAAFTDWQSQDTIKEPRKPHD